MWSDDVVTGNDPDVNRSLDALERRLNDLERAQSDSKWKMKRFEDDAKWEKTIARWGTDFTLFAVFVWCATFIIGLLAKRLGG